MSFVGNLATFLSQSYVSKFLSNILTWIKPIRYAIDDAFQFLFGSIRDKTAHRLLFCLGFATLCFSFYKSMCRTTPILSKLFTFQYNKTSFNKLKFKERYGTNCWALITGFTEGIGYAFARELAKMKYNLVLINKNDGRIESTLRWLKQIHPTIEIKVIELDFNDDSQKVYEKIYNQTNGIDIGIVINNVGISTNGDFINVERNKLLETYRINVNSQVEVSRIFIPRFKHRVNRSAFINMTSSTGIFPRPRFGLYSATKIMSDVFSRVITKQSEHDGVDVLILRPFAVSTAMTNMGKSSLIVNPRQIVQTAFCQLGHVNTSFGTLKHKIGGIVLSELPETQLFFDILEAEYKVVIENK